MTTTATTRAAVAAQAEIDRRAHNKRPGAKFQQAQNEAARKMSGSELAAIAGQAPTVAATVGAAAKDPLKVKANAAFAKAFAAAPEGEKRRAAGRAYRLIMDSAKVAA